jgi:hypothetical protein
VGRASNRSRSPYPPRAPVVNPAVVRGRWSNLLRETRSWQGRLPPELRLAGCTTVDHANRFLRDGYLAEFNRRFQVAAAERGSAFVSCHRRDLDRVFSLQFERTVNRDNTVSFQNRKLQIEPVRWRGTLAGCSVIAHQHLDGTLSLSYGPHCLGSYDADGVPLSRKASPAKQGKEGPPSPATPSPKPTRPYRRGHNFETGHFTCYKTGHFNLLRTVSFSIHVSSGTLLLRGEA